MGMLVLTRKLAETVVLRDATTKEVICHVTVLDVAGSRVRLGFAAGREVEVVRSELLAKPEGRDEQK